MKRTAKNYLALLCAFLLLSFPLRSGEETVSSDVIRSEHLLYGIPMEPDLLLDRKGFAIGYSRRHRQAIWVSYMLTAAHLESPQVARRGAFKADPAVKFRPVRPNDYTRTGYDRGHLAPAADMTYSVDTMKHSFFMTNISPQLPGCNRGIWKRLESQVRLWALRERQLYVVTGPVFADGAHTMGKTDIPVPVAFYKVILDMTPPMKMIGFVIPNQPTKRRLQSFVVSVDDVEALTGCDFFSGLDDETEERLEKEADLSAWK